MAKNHEDKVYPGGIRNRLNRIVFHSGGAIQHLNDARPQAQADGTQLTPRSVISRTTTLPPDARTLQDGTKDADV